MNKTLRQVFAAFTNRRNKEIKNLVFGKPEWAETKPYKQPFLQREQDEIYLFANQGNREKNRRIRQAQRNG